MEFFSNSSKGQFPKKLNSGKVPLKGQHFVLTAWVVGIEGVFSKRPWFFDRKIFSYPSHATAIYIYLHFSINKITIHVGKTYQNLDGMGFVTYLGPPELFVKKC